MNRISWLFRKIFVSALYETNVGIKCFNQILSSDIFDYMVAGNSQMISAKDLYLSFDGLNDRYTLINTPLLLSPHFNMIKSIISGRDIEKTEYIYRQQNGTLDFRQPIRITNNHIQFMHNKLDETVKLIESGGYDPIKITTINQKHYIADGKHRAATCALLGVSPKCINITPILYDSFFWWVHKKMLNSKGYYEKHLLFFNKVKENLRSIQ